MLREAPADVVDRQNLEQLDLSPEMGSELLTLSAIGLGRSPYKLFEDLL